jgi:hypothetical protein
MLSLGDDVSIHEFYEKQLSQLTLDCFSLTYKVHSRDSDLRGVLTLMFFRRLLHESRSIDITKPAYMNKLLRDQDTGRLRTLVYNNALVYIARIKYSRSFQCRINKSLAIVADDKMTPRRNRSVSRVEYFSALQCSPLHGEDKLRAAPFATAVLKKIQRG